MSELGGWIVVLVTTSSREEAEKIAQALIKERLAACINIIDGIKSIYWWKGKIEESKEALMIIKSKINVLGHLIKCVKELHSYTVPEIIALPIISGNSDYLKWIDENVSVK